MLSESARAASAAEARFRIQAPNARPRTTTVIALDSASDVVLRRLAGQQWSRATFLRATVPESDLHAQIDQSDQVIMLAAAGGHADAAEVVGRACSHKRVTTTALVVGAEQATEPELAKTLAQLRPWSLMVVIAGSDDYIADMMNALRV